MKSAASYILLLLSLLTSCSGRHTSSGSLQPDSLRVAIIFYKKLWTTQDLDSAKWYAGLACRYLSKEERKSQVYFAVASRYMDAGKPEQALIYYEKAGEHPDAWTQGRLCEIVPGLYAGMGRYADAIHWLDSARSGRTSRSVIPYYSLAKGNLFTMIGQPDSARHYYEIAAHSLNRWVAETAFRRLKLLYALKGKDSLACTMALNADKMLKEEITNAEFAENRANYEREKMQNELNRLKIDKQRREIMLLSLGLGFILIVFLSYFLLQRRKRQANKLLLQEKTIHLEQAQQLLEQAEELTLLREKESQLRESLFRRMKSFHKIPSLEESKEEEPENSGQRIALSQEEWEDIRQTVDKSYDNFTQRLQQSFPSLSEKDINFCCLVKIGVSIKDLSDIYCISRTSISRKKQRVKRDKLGLTAEDETLDAFLRRF